MKNVIKCSARVVPETSFKQKNIVQRGSKFQNVYNELAIMTVGTVMRFDFTFDEVPKDESLRNAVYVYGKKTGMVFATTKEDKAGTCYLIKRIR